MNYIGCGAFDGMKFEYNTNARLYKALELKLFEDQRDTISFKNLVSSVVDDETQQKIDIVKQRLIKQFGYNETSATDVQLRREHLARGMPRAGVRRALTPAPARDRRIAYLLIAPAVRLDITSAVFGSLSANGRKIGRGAGCAPVPPTPSRPASGGSRRSPGGAA